MEAKLVIANKQDCGILWLGIPVLRSVTYKISYLFSNQSHTDTHTIQPSYMGMPLDMVLACSNYASWICGPFAFGLPSASNKLSQPDSSDVLSTLKNTRKERASQGDRECEGERDKNESKYEWARWTQKETEIRGTREHLKHIITSSMLLVRPPWLCLECTGVGRF